MGSVGFGTRGNLFRHFAHKLDNFLAFCEVICGHLVGEFRLHGKRSVEFVQRASCTAASSSFVNRSCTKRVVSSRILFAWLIHTLYVFVTASNDCGSMFHIASAVGAVGSTALMCLCMITPPPEGGARRLIPADLPPDPERLAARGGPQEKAFVAGE